jgi:hypothetical protein
MEISKAGMGALGLVWAVGVMPGCGGEDSPGGRGSGGSGLMTGGIGASADAACEWTSAPKWESRTKKSRAHSAVASSLGVVIGGR